MKRISVMLLIAFACLCSGCGFFGPQRYVCEADAVQSAQIVRLDRYVEGEYRYEYTILCDIADTLAFVERVNAIEHSVNWGAPMQMDVGYVVIRIDYKNGDFDLLHPSAQCFHRSGENNYGFFFFDKEQFNELISEYLPQ